MAKTFDRQLTDLELEIMQIVWNLGECSIRDIFNALLKERDFAYTTVATIVKILDEKGAISCHKKDRTILVKPQINRAQYEVLSLRYVNERVFQGNPTSMVTRLLDESSLSVDDLKAIKKY